MTLDPWWIYPGIISKIETPTVCWPRDPPQPLVGTQQTGALGIRFCLPGQLACEVRVYPFQSTLGSAQLGTAAAIADSPEPHTMTFWTSEIPPGQVHYFQLWRCSLWHRSSTYVPWCLTSSLGPRLVLVYHGTSSGGSFPWPLWSRQFWFPICSITCFLH